MSSPCPYLPVYVATCLRDQCASLQCLMYLRSSFFTLTIGRWVLLWHQGPDKLTRHVRWPLIDHHAIYRCSATLVTHLFHTVFIIHIAMPCFYVNQTGWTNESSIRLPFWEIEGFRPYSFEWQRVTSKIYTCHFLARHSALLGWCRGWLTHCHDILTEWDINSWCWWPGLPVGKHYKVTMSDTITSQCLSWYNLRCC